MSERKKSVRQAEAYRSGHNEAVLKTVWVQAHGGSNPSASAIMYPTEHFVWLGIFSFRVLFSNLSLILKII